MSGPGHRRTWGWFRPGKRLPAVAQDLTGGQAARSTRYPAPRMRARTAQEEPLHRRTISCPPGDRPHEHELVESHLAVVFVTAGEAEFGFEIER